MSMYPNPLPFPPGPVPGIGMAPQMPQMAQMPMGGPAVGMAPSAEVQREVDKAFLTMQKQRLMQSIQALDAYRTLLQEQLAGVDSQLEKLSQAAREGKDGSADSQVGV